MPAKKDKTSKDFDRALQIGRPPNVVRLFPNSRALIVSEGMHDTAAADIPALIDALTGEIGSLWAPPRHKTILTAGSPRLEF